MNIFTLLSLLFVGTLLTTNGLAQSFGGTSWQGALASTQNPSLTYPTVLTFRVEGTQLTGSAIMAGQGVQELYVLQGMTQGVQAAGTATYPKDGSVFQFEAQLNGAQMVFVVGLNNTPILTGTFARLGSSAARPSASRVGSPQARANVPAADRLPRNPRLVGVWVHSNTHRSGSDFRFTSRSFRYFYPDGRLGTSSGQASASLDNDYGSAHANTDEGEVTIEPGVVWYTKGGEIWLHATQQKMPDQKWAEFYINDTGSAIHLNLGRGNILYERM
jgi:hypothetical protein